MEEVKPEDHIVLRMGKDLYYVIKSFKSSLICDLPMSTSTGSVHLSSSTLDTEHKYDPLCSAVAQSICKNHNTLSSFTFWLFPTC